MPCIVTIEDVPRELEYITDVISNGVVREETKNGIKCVHIEFADKETAVEEVNKLRTHVSNLNISAGPKIFKCLRNQEPASSGLDHQLSEPIVELYPGNTSTSLVPIQSVQSVASGGPHFDQAVPGFFRSFESGVQPARNEVPPGSVVARYPMSPGSVIARYPMPPGLAIARYPMPPGSVVARYPMPPGSAIARYPMPPGSAIASYPMPPGSAIARCPVPGCPCMQPATTGAPPGAIIARYPGIWDTGIQPAMTGVPPGSAAGQYPRTLGPDAYVSCWNLGVTVSLPAHVTEFCPSSPAPVQLYDVTRSALPPANSVFPDMTQLGVSLSIPHPYKDVLLKP